MTILRQDQTELEIDADVMEDDQLLLIKTERGELRLEVRSQRGGVNGTLMMAGTILSAEEVAAIKAWL